MILNDRTKRRVVLQLEELRQAFRTDIKTLKNKRIPDVVINMVRAQYEETIKKMSSEIRRYEELRKKGISALGKITDLRDIGLSLVEARIARGITQAKLAKMLGVDQTQVSRDERYLYRGVTANRVFHILDVLGIDARMTVSPLKKGSTKSGKIKRRTHGKKEV